VQSWDPVGEVDSQDDRFHALDGQALLHHALNHRPCSVGVGYIVKISSGRWAAKLLARLLASAALWVRIQTSLSGRTHVHAT
jgi:hypothetical protein